MSVDDALSRGFDAGNYANAYVSEDFETAWNHEAGEGTYEEYAPDEERKRAYQAAFIIGFFSSYEIDEVSEEHRDDLLEAEHLYGPRMRSLGINAAPRHGFVEPDPLEWESVREQAGILWRVAPEFTDDLPEWSDFCAHTDSETGRYDCGMSRDDHGLIEEE